MRVERGEHALDRALHQRLVVDLVDIVRLHLVVDFHEGVELAIAVGIDTRHRAGSDGNERERADGGSDLEKRTQHHTTFDKNDFSDLVQDNGNYTACQSSNCAKSMGWPRRRSSTVTR